jgi:integrase
VAIRTVKRVRHELNFKEPKTKRSRRTIPIPGFALERLRHHRIEQAQRFMAAGVRPNGDTLVFERDGQPWVPTSFGMVFARLRDAAHLPKVRLHDLRHAYATLMTAAGVDLKTVSTALGHSKVGITAGTYADVRRSRCVKVLTDTRSYLNVRANQAADSSGSSA